LLNVTTLEWVDLFDNDSSVGRRARELEDQRFDDAPLGLFGQLPRGAFLATFTDWRRLPIEIARNPSGPARPVVRCHGAWQGRTRLLRSLLDASVRPSIGRILLCLFALSSSRRGFLAIVLAQPGSRRIMASRLGAPLGTKESAPVD
jgi:hypothetical protein